MCGIAGIIAKDAQKHRSALQAMVAAIKHRGPDDDGVFFYPSCGLGHVRLSIVDLKTGHQPMVDAKGDCAITFNGEIYGYKKIRETLDYPFATASDTEVLLALYQKYGEGMLSHVPGMFAFAIWDEKKQQIFCARDRFGEKPLYYALGRNNEFIFASEIKGILASKLVDPVLDKASLAHYLQHLYIHPTKTIYHNIYTLPPAHALTYKDGVITVKRYWELPETQEGLSLPDAAERFKKLFSSAVEKQLVADVPVGAFLSGGLDSSTVVAVASQYRPGIETFSFGFGDSINELPYARAIAEKYHTHHTELQSGDYDIAQLLMTMGDVYDEPFGDSSNIPTYLIAQAARRHTKVVLAGDGGDELMGGYGWYKPYFYATPHALLRGLDPVPFVLLDFLSRATGRMPGIARSNLKNILRGAGYGSHFQSAAEAHKNQTLVFNNNQLAALGLAGASGLSVQNRANKKHPVDEAMRMDVEDYMPGDILVKTDRASMAHALELRAPFLDMDFASFCLSLPHHLKITPNIDKRMLRHAFGDAWTPEIRKRTKQGFGAPVDRWLALEPVMELKKQYLENGSQRLFDVLPFEAVQKITKGNNYKTWALLVLAVWAEKHTFAS